MDLKRKLAAVLAADIVGYSKLMAEAEEETLQRLEACRAIFKEVAEKHRGRIFNTAGDAVLAELPSAVAATQCALEIQARLATWNADVPEPRKMKMRMGITVGDVFEQDGDLLGDGVNIAARLQALAAPGGVSISRWVHEQVAGKLAARFVDRGEQTVKNIPKPVHVFDVEPLGPDRERSARGGAGRTAVVSDLSRRAGFSGRRSRSLLIAGSIAAATVGLIVAVGSKIWSPSPPVPAKAPQAAFTGVNTGGQNTGGQNTGGQNTGGQNMGGQSIKADADRGSKGQSSVATVQPSGSQPLSAGQSKATAPAATDPMVVPKPVVAAPAQTGLEAPRAMPVAPPQMASADPAAKAPPPTRPAPVKRRSGDTIKDCEACPEMIVVPAGSFSMGSPASEAGREPDEGPQHKVSIGAALAVGRGAVTVRQIEAFVRETGRKGLDSCRAFVAGAWADRPDFSFRNPGFPQTPDHPAVCISWSDAKAFAAWLSGKAGATYRLPTEAEREYFTRAGTTTPFWWGDRITPDQANFDATLTYAGGKPGEYRRATRPVFDFEPNLWGLSQVHGNVAEWVEDCWAKSYDGAPADGSARLTGDCSKRVLRGGAWGYSPKDLRSAYREAVQADQRYYHVGFRLVRELKADER